MTLSPNRKRALNLISNFKPKSPRRKIMNLLRFSKVEVQMCIIPDKRRQMKIRKRDFTKYPKKLSG